MQTVNPLVIVDGKLYKYIDFRPKIRESRVRERYRRVLILLADNIAYYAYLVLEVKKRSEELRRIVKWERASSRGHPRVTLTRYRGPHLEALLALRRIRSCCSESRI